MDAWLVGTGLNVDTLSTFVMDLLVEGGAFDIAAFVLSIDDRFVKFVPTFLYGQDMTGAWRRAYFIGTFIHAVRNGEQLDIYSTWSFISNWAGF